MRLLIATAISLVVCFIFFLMAKIWGSSQMYIEYKHPFYTDASTPLIFKIVNPQNLKAGLKEEQNIYLNVAVTLDKKLIIIDRDWESTKKNKLKFQSRHFSEITASAPRDPVLIENFKDILKDKRIIFNLQDNPLQATPVFVETMKNLGFESGNNFLYLSEYDPPAKDLKSVQPTYLFAATTPEILKIKALESIFLIEAAIYRADVIVHPLTYYNRPFFTPTLIHDLQRRFKKFIIGPLLDSEVEEAKKLNPLGIIVQ